MEKKSKQQSTTTKQCRTTMAQCRWGYWISIIWISHHQMWSFRAHRTTSLRPRVPFLWQSVDIFYLVTNLYGTRIFEGFIFWANEYECRLLTLCFIWCWIFASKIKMNIYETVWLSRMSAKNEFTICVYKFRLYKQKISQKSQQLWTFRLRLCLCLLRSFGFWLIKYTTKFTVRE